MSYLTAPAGAPCYLRPAMAPVTLEFETARGRFAARCGGEGAGPVVLCLHGLLDDARTFDALLVALGARGLRAVAPWSRGYAPSPLGGPFGVDDLVSDLLALGDVLAPGKSVHVVGHGDGARVAFGALARAPGRFERAVALGAPHPAARAANARRSPAQAWRGAPVALLRAPRLAEWALRRHDFALVERLWRAWSPGFEPPPAHLAAVKRTLAASLPAPLERLRASAPPADARPLRVPTLCLLGERDGRSPPALAAGQERFFRAPLVTEVIGSVGHALHLERPELVGAKVAAFLDNGSVR
jgi:pimeloyl-ACP methyl ester carboxylesterase